MWPSLILPPIARILFVEARICFVKNPKLILVRFVIVTPGERKVQNVPAVQIVQAVRAMQIRWRSPLSLCLARCRFPEVARSNSLREALRLTGMLRGDGLRCRQKPALFDR